MITKFAHVRYRVNDLEKTVAFYRDVLGLEQVAKHTSGRGSTLYFFKMPGSDQAVEICHYPVSGPVVVQPDLTHLAFEVDNFDQFFKNAAEKGYPISEGPHGTAPGRMAFIDGPEGYEFEFFEKKK
jgi:lactoylglutathione lyase